METSDADVYSNIGGIDQPTYFSGLTHCSLNREVEGNVLFRIKKKQGTWTGTYLLLIRLFLTSERKRVQHLRP